MDDTVERRPPRDFTLLLGLLQLIPAWDDIADRQVVVTTGGRYIVYLERFVSVADSSHLGCCSSMWYRLWSNACRHAVLCEFGRPGYLPTMNVATMTATWRPGKALLLVAILSITYLPPSAGMWGIF